MSVDYRNIAKNTRGHGLRCRILRGPDAEGRVWVEHFDDDGPAGREWLNIDSDLRPALALDDIKTNYGPWEASEVTSGETEDELVLRDRRVRVCTYPGGAVFWFACWKLPARGPYDFDIAQGTDLDSLGATLVEHFHEARLGLKYPQALIDYCLDHHVRIASLSFLEGVAEDQGARVVEDDGVVLTVRSVDGEDS